MSGMHEEVVDTDVNANFRGGCHDVYSSTS